jgi:TctA family transporter
MKDFFLTKILQYLSRRFDGYKTYAGAAGKALAGLGTLISGIIGLIGIAFPDQGLPQMDIQSALGLIGAGAFAISSGLSSYGVGKKLDKAADQRVAISETAQNQRIDIAAIAQTDTTRAGGLAPR